MHIRDFFPSLVNNQLIIFLFNCLIACEIGEK